MKDRLQLPSSINVFVTKLIESLLLSKNIEFVGIRYSEGDVKKAQFDPQLSIIQLLAFIEQGKIISDKEALAVKLGESQTDWEKIFDAFILSNNR